MSVKTVVLYREALDGDLGTKKVTNTHISFNDVCILINPDFSDSHRGILPDGSCTPTENHRCHIFINDITVVTESLKAYVRRWIRYKGRKIIIHTSKSRPDIKHALEELFVDIDKVKIIASKNTAGFVFYVDSGDSYWSLNKGVSSYLLLQWMDFTCDMIRAIFTNPGRLVV